LILPEFANQHTIFETRFLPQAFYFSSSEMTTTIQYDSIVISVVFPTSFNFFHPFQQFFNAFSTLFSLFIVRMDPLKLLTLGLNFVLLWFRYARGRLNLGISHANLQNYEGAARAYLR